VCLSTRAPPVPPSDEKVRYSMNRIFRRNQLKCLNTWKAHVARAHAVRSKMRRALATGVRQRFGQWQQLVQRRRAARLRVAQGLRRLFKARRCAAVPWRAAPCLVNSAPRYAATLAAPFNPAACSPRPVAASMLLHAFCCRHFFCAICA
jgi:hypothetical protein